MTTRVADMTVEELKTLINQSVQESMEGVMEDMAALASPAHLKSIENARRQYERGEITSLDEVTLEFRS